MFESILKKSYKDVWEDEKSLRFFMKKTDNRFVISLDLGYFLHHCHAKNSLNIYASTVAYTYQKYIQTVAYIYHIYRLSGDNELPSS